MFSLFKKVLKCSIPKNFTIVRFSNIFIELYILAAGDKKNTAGEQVHGIYSTLKGVGLRSGSWSAGCIETSEGFL